MNAFRSRHEERYRDAAVGDGLGRERSPSRLLGRNAALLGAGAALAAAAVYVQMRTREAENTNPPAGRFIEVEGVRLHYLERGQGQPLVLLHGNGSMIQDFETSGLIEEAAKHYRVIAFDRPGYGYSTRPRSTIWGPQAQAELLHHALHLMGISRPIVVGHSWGAMVAATMALDYPGAVKGLVLMSGYYYPTARLDVPFASQPAIPLIGDLLRYTVSPLLSRMMWPAVLRKLFGPKEVPERFAREYSVWMTLRPSQLRAAAAEAALMIPAAFSLRNRYRELDVPVAIVTGSSDRQVSSRFQSERLHDEVRRSTLHVATGVGHMVHHFAQGEILSAIEEVGKELPQRQAVPRIHAQRIPLH
ncbi:alpha/beta fold hydrolase [Noviherbaspirillum galbum]|nr:alpha/beta hydrolase [Noviherbaspirillum galbum]